jgi:hypothetical protein
MRTINVMMLDLSMGPLKFSTKNLEGLKRTSFHEVMEVNVCKYLIYT